MDIRDKIKLLATALNEGECISVEVYAMPPPFAFNREDRAYTAIAEKARVGYEPEKIGLYFDSYGLQPPPSGPVAETEEVRAAMATLEYGYGATEQSALETLFSRLLKTFANRSSTHLQLAEEAHKAAAEHKRIQAVLDTVKI